MPDNLLHPTSKFNWEVIIQQVDITIVHIARPQSLSPEDTERSAWSKPMKLTPPEVGSRKNDIQPVRCAGGGASRSFYCHSEWEDGTDPQKLMRTLSFRPFLKVTNLLPYAAKLQSSSGEPFVLAPGESQSLSSRGDYWQHPELDIHPAAVAIGLQNLSRVTTTQTDQLRRVFDAIGEPAKFALCLSLSSGHASQFQQIYSILLVFAERHSESSGHGYDLRGSVPYEQMKGIVQAGELRFIFNQVRPQGKAGFLVLTQCFNIVPSCLKRCISLRSAVAGPTVHRRELRQGDGISEQRRDGIARSVP